MSEDALSFIPTRSSAANKRLAEDFKAVTYCAYKKKHVDTNKVLTKNKISTGENDEETFNIKQARHEIIKFGMSGFNSTKKEKAKVRLAISLGAKPPRNKSKNYKQLLDEKKKSQEAKKLETDLQQLGKNKVGNSTAKGKSYDRKRRKQKSDLLDAYGQVKVTSKSHKR